MDWTLALVAAAGLSLAVRLRLRRSGRAGAGFAERAASAAAPWLVALLIVRTFAVEPFCVASGSMEPALERGDVVIALKSAYGLRIPVIGRVLFSREAKRGDIVLFRRGGAVYIKRVAAVPGDTVEISGGRVAVNGSLGGAEAREVIRTRLPRGRYFLLGDNADNSLDSRTFGSVPAEAVLGRAAAVVRGWRISFLGGALTD